MIKKKKYRDDEMENQKTIIIGIIIVVAIIIIGAATAYSMMNNKKELIEINDLNIEKDQWGIYKIVGHITPLKDIKYLEARITLYDAHGTVIGECPLAWNMNNLKQGQKVSVGTSLGATTSGVPAYGVISFYDKVNGNEPVANFTVHFNGTNNNTKNTTVNENSNNAPSSSNDSGSHNSNVNDANDKRYTQQDLNRARADGYLQGYDDSMSYNDYGYDWSSSSSSSSGSSSSGSGSGGSNVESTLG